MPLPATLAVNVGSSSVKVALFTFEDEPHPLARETIETGGSAAAAPLIDWVDRHGAQTTLAAIGHRIVHGGSRYRDPTRVTPAVLDALRELVPFAPNHLPDEIRLVEALAARRPAAPQVACFDTAFHADLPAVARRLPIPGDLDARGIRRYGFHGLSYTFLMQELARLAGAEAAAGRVILAHLGNGSSLAAVRRGQSLDTTMGFTPIGGVVMSTRSGDLDPGVVTYLARSGHLSADDVEQLLSLRAGLVAISGTSGDMRTLLAREADDAACRLAVASYVYGIQKAIGAMAAVLGGLDTLVFSGGIGEHAAAIRARVCGGLAFLGIQLDETRNGADATLISPDRAQVAVRVIPTDEELTIARAVYRLLARGLV